MYISDRSKARVLLRFSVACFGVSFSAVFAVCVCGMLSSVYVAVWPPFGKELLTRLIVLVCSLCNLSICSYLNLVLRKPVFCICENKDADQLRGNREADQRLCFRYTDSTITQLPKTEISSL